MSDTSIRPTHNFQTASIKLLLPIAHKRQLQHAHVHFFAAQQHFSRVAFKGFGHAGYGDGLFQAGLKHAAGGDAVARFGNHFHAVAQDAAFFQQQADLFYVYALFFQRHQRGFADEIAGFVF